MALTLLLFFVGLILLYFGAEWLVAGSSSGALRFGIPPLIVGLTVVAFGTSAPELLVSLLALTEGKDGISIGNIIGSNIANIALILGCSSLINPIEVAPQVLRRDFPIMLIASLLLVLLCYDGQVSRLDGALMVGGMLTYIGYSIKRAMRISRERGVDLTEEVLDEVVEEFEGLDPSQAPFWMDLLKIAGGVLGLAGGAYLLVESAVQIAHVLHIPDLVIGITVVAVGTSLPELATSVVAAYRKQSDISVGNVIGSNIFNILLVLGLVAVIWPMTLPDRDALLIDLLVMLGVSVLIWPIMRTGFRISRLEGGLLLVGYVAYTIYLFVR